MKIVIAGAGEVGLHLSKMLSYESHDITLVDNNEIKLKDGENYLDIKVINGDSSSPSVLNKANVSNSDLVIGVTASESINFFTCILSKKLGAKRTIARLTNTEFIDNDNKFDFFSIFKIWNKLLSEDKLNAFESFKEFYHLTNLDTFKKLQDF